MKLSIVILSFNTKELLKKCLESVFRSFVKGDSGKGDTEIIVVDNNSNDGSWEMVVKDFPEVKIIKNKENLGFAKGNNIGIKQAKGDYIMLLNSDTLVKEGGIEKLAGFLDNHEEVDIAGPKLLNIDGTSQANCGRFPTLFVSAIMLFVEHYGTKFVRFSPLETRPVDWLMGSALMARKKVFETIGGLDEEFFMYMEEVEWFYRAKKAGFKTYFLKEAEITHLGRGSSTSGKKEPIINIYKGLLYFYKKHKSFPEPEILKLMLKLKAASAFFLGWLMDNHYLKDTYGEAFKLN